MNVARFNATATVFNDHICVAGGEYKDFNGGIKSVEFYNPNSHQRFQLAEMNQHRAEFGLFELNGFLYAIGFHEDIEKYDPWIKCWTKVFEFVSRLSRARSHEFTSFSGWIIRRQWVGNKRNQYSRANLCSNEKWLFWADPHW